MVDACCGLRSETFLRCVEHYTVLKCLIPRLVHRLGALSLTHLGVFVETWSWHFELQALSIEDLTMMETRRCSIETNAFASNRFIIASSCASLTPLCSVLEASDLIFDAKDGLFIVDMLACITLSDDLATLSSVRPEDANAWILS